jgi:hypothetical protein
MLIRVAWRTALAIVAAALVLAGCGGGDDARMTATLTDDACTYEGSTTPRAGRFDIAVANETRFFSAFFVAAVERRTELDDMQAVIDDLLRRFRKSGESPARTPWRDVVGSEVEPAATSVIPADVEAGTYVVLCFVQESADRRLTSQDRVPPRAVYAAARLDVTGTPTYP